MSGNLSHEGKLSARERKCCHMGQWPASTGTLEQWREEFRANPDDHCRDCPLDRKP